MRSKFQWRFQCERRDQTLELSITFWRLRRELRFPQRYRSAGNKSRRLSTRCNASSTTRLSKRSRNKSLLRVALRSRLFRLKGRLRCRN